MEKTIWLVTFLFYFLKNDVFIEEEDNPLEKVVIVEEELGDNGNLEDLPKLVFMGKECGNLKVLADGGDLTRNNNFRKSYVLQASRCPLRDGFHQ